MSLIYAEIYNTKYEQSYLSQVKRLSGQKRVSNYWEKIEELYARSFESVIEDLLNEHGINCPWLVAGTRAQDYPAANIRMLPYPVGEQRKKFKKLYMNLFRELAKK